jgi:hypothetical protein
MNIHLRVMPRLRMSGAFPPLPLIPSLRAQRGLFYFIVVVNIVISKQLFEAYISKSLQREVVCQRTVNCKCAKLCNCRICVCLEIFTSI